MPIRNATLGDLQEIAEVLAAAFHDNNTYYAYFFPHREKYHDDYKWAWKRMVEAHYWDYHKVILVNFAEGEKRINGVSIWHRSGAGSDDVWGLKGRYLLPAVQAVQAAERMIFTNRSEARPSSADPHPIRRWEIGSVLGPFVGHLFTEPESRRNHWELDALGVLPECHGKGIGRLLVQKGLDRARRDQLLAVVICAENVENFYRKCGFVVNGGNVTAEDRISTRAEENGKMTEVVMINPLRQRGIAGGEVLWTR